MRKMIFPQNGGRSSNGSGEKENPFLRNQQWMMNQLDTIESVARSGRRIAIATLVFSVLTFVGAGAITAANWGKFQQFFSRSAMVEKKPSAQETKKEEKPAPRPEKKPAKEQPQKTEGKSEFLKELDEILGTDEKKEEKKKPRIIIVPSSSSSDKDKKPHVIRIIGAPKSSSTKPYKPKKPKKEKEVELKKKTLVGGSRGGKPKSTSGSTESPIIMGGGSGG